MLTLLIPNSLFIVIALSHSLIKFPCKSNCKMGLLNFKTGIFDFNLLIFLPKPFGFGIEFAIPILFFVSLLLLHPKAPLLPLFEFPILRFVSSLCFLLNPNPFGFGPH